MTNKDAPVTLWIWEQHLSFTWTNENAPVQTKTNPFKRRRTRYITFVISIWGNNIRHSHDKRRTHPYRCDNLRTTTFNMQGQEAGRHQKYGIVEGISRCTREKILLFMSLIIYPSETPCQTWQIASYATCFWECRQFKIHCYQTRRTSWTA